MIFARLMAFQSFAKTMDNSGVDTETFGEAIRTAFVDFRKTARLDDPLGKKVLAQCINNWVGEDVFRSSLDAEFSKIKLKGPTNVRRAWAILYCFPFFDRLDISKSRCDPGRKTALEFSIELEEELLPKDDLGNKQTYRSINLDTPRGFPEDLIEEPPPKGIHRPFFFLQPSQNRNFDKRLRSKLFQHFPDALWIEFEESDSKIADLRNIALSKVGLATHFVPILGDINTYSTTQSCFIAARSLGLPVIPLVTFDLNKETTPIWVTAFKPLDARSPKDLDDLEPRLAQQSEERRAYFAHPDPPEVFIPRPKIMARIKAKLAAPQGPSLALSTSIQGAGGFGKTYIANALCRDEDVRARFFDGIYRIVVGLDATKSDVAGKVLNVAKSISGDASLVLFNEDEAASLLANAIGSRRILIVADDIWKDAQLDPLRINHPELSKLCPNASLVITTRRDHFGRSFGDVIDVDAMEPEESLRLISYGFERLGHPELETMRRVCKKLHNWCLLLSIVNRFLVSEVQKHRVSFEDAIEDLEKEISESIEPLRVENSDDRMHAAGWSIALGLNSIDPDAQGAQFSKSYFRDVNRTTPIASRFLELGVFPEDTDIPEEIIECLWKETAGYTKRQTRSLIRAMDDLAILNRTESSGGGTIIRIHDSHLHFASREIQARGDLGRINSLLGLSLRGDFLKDSFGSQVKAEYFFLHGAQHLIAAELCDEVKELLMNFRWFQNFLRVAPSFEYVCSMYLNFEGEVRGVGEALLVGHVVISVYFDPLLEASAIAGILEQLDTDEIQDHELLGLE